MIISIKIILNSDHCFQSRRVLFCYHDKPRPPGGHIFKVQIRFSCFIEGHPGNIPMKFGLNRFSSIGGVVI